MMLATYQPHRSLNYVLALGPSAPHTETRGPSTWGFFPFVTQNPSWALGSSLCPQKLWEGWISSQQEGHRDDTENEKGASWVVMGEGTHLPFPVSLAWPLLLGTETQGLEAQWSRSCRV